MISADEWLPELVLFEDSKGNWSIYLEVIYGHFLDDFVRSKPSWPGKKVGLKRYPESQGKSATFWHFISEGKVERERLVDFRRCERIRWPRPVMDRFSNKQPEQNDRILWWKETRGTETRYILAPTDFCYVVVVVDRGEYVLPWTAYFLEKDHQRRKSQKKFDDYWKKPW